MRALRLRRWGPCSGGQVVSRPVLVAAAVGSGSAVGAAAGSVAAAAYFARRVLTPDELQPDNVMILGHDADSVTFTATLDTTGPGRYGVWLAGGLGHARVGQVLRDGRADRDARARRGRPG